MHSYFMRPLAAGCCWLALAQGLACGQQPQNQQPVGPTLKVSTEVVSVYAIVEGKHHNLIPNLEKQDFEIDEDGVRQQIRYFSRETDTPLTMGLLIDTSPSQQRVLSIEQEQAKAFLDQVMRPKDLTFILHFDLEVELLQDFTADRRLLAKAIDETQINGGGGAGPTPGTFPTSARACCTYLYDAVYLASNELMRNEVGRKVVILLTDGVDAGSKEKPDAALQGAQKSNLMIYSIDISDASFYFMGGFGFGGGESTLKKFSEETGGRVIRVRNQKETAAAFQQIADELRTQYLLGYTPTNSRHDGTFRRIHVRVLRGDSKVQTRHGYYAPSQ
jgi:VWFA-related protein